MSGTDAPLAVTDTHALIWAVGGKRKGLGKRARRIFDQADERQGAIYIPAFSLVELGEALRRGILTLQLPFEEWSRAAFASGKYHEAELTAEIVYATQRLYAIPEPLAAAHLPPSRATPNSSTCLTE